MGTKREMSGRILLLSVLAAGLLMGGGVRADEAKPATAETLRQQVWEFEQSLRPLPEAERAARVLQYFAGLKDVEARIEALGMLDSRYLYVVPKSVMDELLEPLLRDPDDRLRMRAARAVAYNGLASRHAEALLAMLKSPEIEVRLSAMSALGRSRDRQFLPMLRPDLTAADPRLRAGAATSVWTLKQDDPALEPLLKDPDPMVRGLLVQLLPQARDAARLLKDPVPDVRGKAARSIGESGDRRQAPAIAALLKDGEPGVRGQAVYALGHLKAAEFGGRIAAILQSDPDVVPQRYAAEALGEIRLRAYLPALRAALLNEDEQVRKRAARSIKLIENPELNPDAVQ